MGPELITQVSQEALWVLLKLSMPLLLVALIAGTIVSLLQALTQMQEPTLTLVPKLLALLFTILFTMSYMGEVMHAFTMDITSMIINIE